MGLNMADPLPDLIDEVGTADDNPLALIEAVRNDHALCVYRQNANRLWLEAFRRRVQPDNVLAVATSNNGVARKDQAGHRCAALNHHVQGLADIEARRGLRYGEMDDRCVLPQGTA